MTKKQLKALAKKISELERIIQNGNDSNEVRLAKEEMIKLNESAELDLDDMLRLDEEVQKLLLT